jgi:light-regulated signal transduction histidine kinase (bacteriophytochrome)
MIWKDYAEMPTAANICGNPQPSFAKPFADFTSSPWQPYEVEAALELRNVLLNLIIQRASELNRVNKELAKSNAELDTFAYVVSHDLKEPLRGIRYYVMVLLDDYGNKLNTPGIIQLETIKRLTQYMEELIESLLEYSRVGQIDLAMQPTDLNKVVEQALEILHLRHREVELTIHIPKPLPTISCDPARIGQLFANLISNAVKYNDKAKKQIEIGYQESSEKPHYLFHIRDNGIGIREHQFDKIFQVFKRLHGREQFGGGTGVGLAIVKKIVERHQGKIWVESNYGQGTTFYFTLETDEI